MRYGKEKMETKNLKVMINNFLDNFNAKKINEYFATDFSDDWEDYFIKENYSNIEEVLQYLNDNFIDIDVDYRDTKQFESKVKEMLNKAIEMLECTK